MSNDVDNLEVEVVKSPRKKRREIAISTAIVIAFVASVATGLAVWYAKEKWGKRN